MNPASLQLTRRRGMRRSFATFLVLWTVAIVALILTAVQASSWRGAAAGRRALAEVRAKWAARAGVEAAIAAITSSALDANSDNTTLQGDLEAAASGELELASYEVAHETEQGLEPGPTDAHAKININLMDAEGFMLLPEMSPDIADAILDWIDADDNPNPSGAEAGQYTGSTIFPYEPRNGTFRTLTELELVAGVYPDMVRGEDWNLNGRLDPEEDDGAASFPADNADGKLDAGWSALLTAYSHDGGLAKSGEPRLDLSSAESSEIASRIRVTNDQAEAISTHVSSGGLMSDFLRTPLAQLAAATQTPPTPQVPGQPAPPVPDLTDEQLTLLLDECTADPPGISFPGRVNINTCPAEVLEYLPGLDPEIADSVIFEREARRSAGGFASIVEMRTIPSLSREAWANLADMLDVRSNVFVVTSRGKDQPSGLEVEIIAVIDRSALPVVIQDLRTR